MIPPRPRIPPGCPTYSPWGKVQAGKLLVPGVYEVTTAGHGGIALDEAANRRIPEAFRNTDTRYADAAGWYEEDEHVAAVYWFLPEAAAAKPNVDRLKCKEELRTNWSKEWAATYSGVPDGR